MFLKLLPSFLLKCISLTYNTSGNFAKLTSNNKAEETIKSMAMSNFGVKKINDSTDTEYCIIAVAFFSVVEYSHM